MTEVEATTSPEVVLSAAGVRKLYGSRRGPQLHALDGVDLDLRRGEILALVGESGSGKSTLAEILAGGFAPSSGTVSFDGAELSTRRDRSFRRRVQMVFQDPYASLNPRMTVRQVLAELLRVHRVVPDSEIPAELGRLMDLVGLPADALDAYPSQFSGGQRQRIAIARALAVRPDVLIADEPVSALDVSVQATILDLLSSLKRELGLSVLFIAHNLAVVQHLADRIAVMYLGRIVEVAATRDLFRAPMHPYTQALIRSAPRMTLGDLEAPPALEGEPPSPIHLPQGCRFHPRCAYAQPECLQTDPVLTDLDATGVDASGPDGTAPGEGHRVACLFAGRWQARSIDEGERT